MTTAIITGGSRGLGLALAADLAGDGWHVVVDGRDATRLRAAVADLGPGVEAIPGDVADPAHRAALVEAAGRSGRLDLVVNNASGLGPSPLPPLRDHPLDVLEELYRVN